MSNATEMGYRWEIGGSAQLGTRKKTVLLPSCRSLWGSLKRIPAAQCRGAGFGHVGPTRTTYLTSQRPRHNMSPTNRNGPAARKRPVAPPETTGDAEPF